MPLLQKKNDHKVTLFLAGDGVKILNCKKAGEIVGQGTGDLYEHLQNLKNSKITIYVSGMSAKSRGFCRLFFYASSKRFTKKQLMIIDLI